jgi:DNA-binding response OmpR family regulator
VLYSFEDFLLDSDRRELSCNGSLIAVEPLVFDLLHFLIRERDRVISKDELIAGVWSGRIVSESTLTSRINAARQAVAMTENVSVSSKHCLGEAFALSAKPVNLIHWDGERPRTTIAQRAIPRRL